MASLVVAGVTALGFTSSGITAGSVAAGMMSATAPVASGSVVAVCQSIGATGAVSTTTEFIANSALGSALGGAYIMFRRFFGVNPDDDDDDSDDDDDNPKPYGMMVLA